MINVMCLNMIVMILFFQGIENPTHLSCTGLAPINQVVEFRENSSALYDGEVQDKQTTDCEKYIFQPKDRCEFQLKLDNHPKGKVTVFLPPDNSFIVVPILKLMSALDIPTEIEKDHIKFCVNGKPCIISITDCTLNYDGSGDLLDLAPGSTHYEYKFWDDGDFYVDTDTFLAFSHSILGIYISADFDSKSLLLTSVK